DIRERKEHLMTKQAKLNDKLSFLKDKEEYIGILKDQIQKNKNKHEVLYKDLMVQKNEYEKRIHQLEQDSQELEKLISKMQRQSQNQSRIGDGRFIWPVLGEITSDFGERVHPIFKVKSFHTGIDIGSPTGRPVFAVDDGVVMFSGNWGGYGKTIIIDHGAMTTTLYAHLSQYFVKKSVAVKKGQIIGLVGSTGLSTGSHLHFEVRIDGKEKNPINYLPKK
ncbi:MAG: peptidoglycan DD-metalloendopeptidase family protein, partial [Candidatus Margulisbacteria bacterium]|nr:peptidoglycan DD-metalloendopeptidase family protein [Candidatus Margulisiibacteriota bacterium]